MNKRERLNQANRVIASISRYGRRFFYDEPTGRVSYLKLRYDGQLVFVDSYTGREVYMRARPARNDGFTGGGTLRSIVSQLMRYVRTGECVPGHFFGPFHENQCNGDPWGYGADLKKLQREVRCNPAVEPFEVMA